MNNLLINLKKATNYLSYPFIFASILLILANFLSLMPVNEFSTIKNYFNANLSLLLCALIPAFIVFYACENIKKSIVSSFSVIASDLALYATTEKHYGILIIVIFSYLCLAVCKNFDLIYSFIILIFSLFVFSIIIGLIYDYLYNILTLFAGLFKNKPSLFGAINNLYLILFGDSFEYLFYYKQYSSSTIINSRVISGAINIFTSSINSPKIVVSRYLTGKYLVNIFMTIGCVLSLFSRLNKNEKYSFISISFLAIIFGDVRLLALFIFLYNPAAYLTYLVLIFISYLVPRLIDIRIGFVDNGSIFELFKYGNKWFYFLLIGAVIAALSYFSINLTIAKFDIQNGKFLSREVKQIVLALGGEKNIERIQRDSILVRNPNLIDIIRLDCDIHENKITLHYDDLELLKEYL